MKYQRRQDGFELDLSINDERFMAPLNPGSRDGLVERAMQELGFELKALARAARASVPGRDTPLEKPVPTWGNEAAQYDGSQLIIAGHEVMQDWERPLMRAMAEAVTETHGDVLEVGFGMGISASYILERGVRSYTVIEPNAGVCEEFERWRKRWPGQDVRLARGTWQAALAGLGQFDGMFFDIFPSTAEEMEAVRARGPESLALSFVEAAVGHLRPGGAFTFYTGEIDSVGRELQRQLLRYFRSVTVSVVDGLRPPPDCTYYWAPTMAVIKAIKA